MQIINTFNLDIFFFNAQNKEGHLLDRYLNDFYLLTNNVRSYQALEIPQKGTVLEVNKKDNIRSVPHKDATIIGKTAKRDLVLVENTCFSDYNKLDTRGIWIKVSFVRFNQINTSSKQQKQVTEKHCKEYIAD